MIAGSDLRADRRRLIVYIVLVTVPAVVVAIVGISTAKPALFTAALVAWLFVVARALLEAHRERVRRRDEG